MYFNSRSAVPLGLLVGLAVSANAQQPMGKYDGVWHNVSREIVSPDSTSRPAPLQGMAIFRGNHFVQVWLSPALPGVQQASRVTTAQEKAARYDLLSANGGTFEVRDDTLIIAHYDVAKNPASMGANATLRSRLVADTLWTFSTSRWPSDTTKFVHSTTKFVRKR